MKVYRKAMYFVEEASTLFRSDRQTFRVKMVRIYNGGVLHSPNITALGYRNVGR